MEWRYLAQAWAAMLVLLSFSLTPDNDAALPPVDLPSPSLEIPRTHAGWIGEDLRPDTLMIGQLPLGEILLRRYEKAGTTRTSVVDLFVAYESDEADRLSPFSSKLLLPGHGWSLEERTQGRVWNLGIEATRAHVSRPGARVLVYRWHVRDSGPVRENIRSLLALGAVQEGDAGRRIVVRASTPLAGLSPLAKDRSKQRLDRFMHDFRKYLADL